MNILGLITARGGSKGIPGKNIKLLGGKPLLGYVAEDAKKAKRLNRIVLSTDDEKIAKVAESFGIEVPFIRPAELALDSTPTVDVIKHCLDYFYERGITYNAVCLLQPTSPFKSKGFIDECIDRFITTDADTLISVLPVPHQFNPHWVFEEYEYEYLKIATGETKLIPQRQMLPKAFYRDGSVYIFKTENVLKHNNIVFGKITYLESDPSYYCNLDSMQDWELAEQHLFIN